MPHLDETKSGTATLPVVALDSEAVIDTLITRYRNANGTLFQIVTFVGGQLEGAVARLPAATRTRLEDATRAALAAAYGAARSTHARRLTGDRAHRNAAIALGAMGGLGGLPTALAELPVTTTMILRSIQEIARHHGEDLSAEETRLACLQVLGAGGPLAEDDGTDFAFLGAKLTLTGPALGNLIAAIAPRFTALLGTRLAAMAVPAIGAVAGAGTSLAFTRYYQEMAHVHFGLRRLSSFGALDAPAAFRARIEAEPAIRRA